MSWQLVYTIVHSILHRQIAVYERCENDIISNYFEILKGELTGVDQRQKIANCLHSLTEIKSQSL